MKNILVIAPHPDDETLGCGGAMLKHKALGDAVHWLIVTSMTLEQGYTMEQIAARNAEIEAVARRYEIAALHTLGLPTTLLDTLPMDKIIKGISQVFQAVQPQQIYLPYRGDVHTDHRYVFDAVSACTKWFRYNSVQRVLAYETLSETDFGIDPAMSTFNPNVFIDISDYIETKLEIMRIYASELGEYPFPRSEQAIRALAAVRGVASGCCSAEAFMLLKEIL